MSSKSFVRMYSKLHTTVEHFETVDVALRNNRSVDNNAIVNHAITRNCELVIQLLYTHINEFMKSILQEMFNKRPLQIVGDSQSMLKFFQIVELGSYQAICDHMLNQVFRKLTEERSVKKQIEKLLSYARVQVPSDTLDDAMFYIEVRHLIVHNSSLMDKAFEEKYETRFKHVRCGNKIPINQKVVRDGVKAIQKLCQEIDRSLLSNGYINSSRE